MVDLLDSKGITTIKGCRPSKKYQRYFNRVNKLYFENSLPETKILVAPLLKITQLSQKMVSSGNCRDAGLYGICGTDQEGNSCIILDKGTAIFHPILTRQTILHESAHLYMPDYKGHGKLFKAQIRRIASLGALDNLI